MLKSKKYDVVIIGAGVQGLSAAFFLSRNGRKRIAVIDKGRMAGTGSSSRSGSMIMKSRENAPKIQLSLYSFDFFQNFSSIFGQKLYFRRTGFLSLVPEKLESRYRKEHLLRCDLGVPSSILSISEVEELCPAINTSGLDFGLYCPDDGEVESSQILNCYERYSLDHGVDFYFHEEVQQFDTTNGHLTGVYTDKTYFSSEFVVNASGENASGLSEMLNISIPQDNRRRSIFFCRIEDSEPFKGPMVEDAEIEWYYRQLKDGRILIGMGSERTTEDTKGPNFNFLPIIREATQKRAPKLADFIMEDGHSGIRPLTPDILPIIGSSPVQENFILSSGWGGEGIMHSPGGGAIVSDLIDGTKNYPFDTSCFSPGRFSQVN